MTTPRDQFLEWVTPVIPEDWKLVGYERNLDVLDQTTVQLKQSELQLKAQGQQQEGALKQGQAQASVQDDAQDRQAKAQELALESSDRAADRQAAEESHRINLATEQAKLEIEQEKLAAARENRQRMFGPEQQAGTLGPKPEHEGEGQ